MKLRELIAWLHMQGVRLSLDGDSLDYDAPKGAMTPELLGEMRRRKRQLVTWLAGRGKGDRPLELAPMSLVQERLWMGTRTMAEQEQAQFNIVRLLTLTGRLDRAALGRALNGLVERHAAMRIRLAQHGKYYLQEVLAPRPLPVVMTDLSELPEKDALVRAEALCQAEARTPIMLSEAPLFRVHLLKLAEEQWQLLLVIHHGIFDGWSLSVMMQELSVLYTAALSGEPSPLAPPAMQYTDFTRWERVWMDAGRVERMLQYWKAELEGVPLTLNMPYDRPPTAQASHRGARHTFHIPRDRVAVLEGLARRHGTTLYTILLSTFVLQLSHLCQQEDFMVLIPVANRVRREHESILGLFTGNVPFRARLEGVPTFGKLVERVSRTFFAAVDRQELPLSSVAARLIKAYQEANPGAPRLPLFQVLFNLLNVPPLEPTLPGLTAKEQSLSNDTSTVDLALWMNHAADGGLNSLFEYQTDLFDSATMVRWAEHFVHLLGQVGQDADRPLGEYRLPAAGT